ncbi:MAG TPA: Maf family protein [Planctomycetia bacterium]|nr:Maf family protein [Planctomycetia bacterium]
MPFAFVLASSSPRRRELLTQAGYQFEVVPCPEPEPDPRSFHDVASFVQHAAHRKAAWVAGRAPATSRWILGADTVAEYGGEVLGKPSDRADAERILRKLQGTEHQTWTGLCLLSPEKGVALLAAEMTVVHFRRVPEPALAAYLDGGAWQGKAGAYGIQDHDDPFVERFIGSHSNVVGMPLERLAILMNYAQAIDASRL